MADDEDRIKPWTIKGIPPEARNAAIAAAEREKQTLGEWVARAIRSQIQSGRQQARAPAMVGPAVSPGADLADVERVVSMAAQLAAAGAPPPKAVSRAAYGLLREALGRMKAGPTEGQFGRTKTGASPTHTANGQTDQPDGPTKASDSPTKSEPSQTEPA